MLYDWEQFTILQKITFIFISVCILPIDMILYGISWVGQQAYMIKHQFIDNYTRMMVKSLGFPLKKRV